MTWRGVRTVMVLELRQRVRATRWRVMLGIWLAVLILLCGGLAIAVETTTRETTSDYLPFLYDTIVCFVLGIGLIVAPTLSATSLNGDRADATLAAWAAAIAFLGVAAPFLLILTVAGGSHWQALLAHLVILVFTLGAVCAIGLGFSSLTARPSASAVLTYLVVAALTVGTPLSTAVASSVVTGTQTVETRRPDYEASTTEKTVCRSDIDTQVVTRSERIWWMLAPNPFVALGDATAHAPQQPASTVLGIPTSYLSFAGKIVDSMRNPRPDRIVHNRCAGETATYEDDDLLSLSHSSKDRGPLAEHLVFWPASLVVILALGAGGVVTASRRLRVPTGRLPRGVRLA